MPDEISALLSGSPTASQHKGQERKSKSGVVGIAKTGSWRLTATRREPEDLEAQMGSTPFSRTLTRRPIKAMRSVHVKA
ncbi:DUF4279 domain-containing protein, partial [Xanthomonas euvesicatoria]|uniref:DUF4279 domain-containing protein n=1 Tax=Xanthomonas euvesicatoria TaxID=456327 RepID=UPI0031F3197F